MNNKPSDILKEKKVDLQRQLQEVDSSLTQINNTLSDTQDTRTDILNQIAQIDIYLEKENELDTLFD